MNTLTIGGDGDIGAALTSLLAKDPANYKNFATSRRAEPPEDADADAEITWLPLDLASKRSIKTATQHLGSSCSSLDLIVFASGYLHGDNGDPEKGMKEIESSNLIHSYLVNTVGPLLFFKDSIKLIKSSKRPIVVFLSAQVGSIEDNRTGGWYSYRMAKAALNMAVKNLALECSRMPNKPIVVAVHPGTTATKLSKPFLKHRKAVPSEPIDTASAILRLVDGLQTSDSGKFLTTSGKTLPW